MGPKLMQATENVKVVLLTEPSAQPAQVPSVPAVTTPWTFVQPVGAVIAAPPELSHVIQASRTSVEAVPAGAPGAQLALVLLVAWLEARNPIAACSGSRLSPGQS
jgi:hypothetical protein